MRPNIRKRALGDQQSALLQMWRARVVGLLGDQQSAKEPYIRKRALYPQKSPISAKEPYIHSLLRTESGENVETCRKRRSSSKSLLRIVADCWSPRALRALNIPNKTPYM